MTFKTYKEEICPCCGRMREPDELTLDVGRSTVTVGDRVISLTKSEFVIFEKMARNNKRTVTKWALYENLYPVGDYPTDQKIVDVFVSKIRRKFEGTPLRAAIQTYWGQGYSLNMKNQPAFVGGVVDNQI